MWINHGQLSPYTSGADSRDKRGICHNLEDRSFTGGNEGKGDEGKGVISLFVFINAVTPFPASMRSYFNSTCT
jgi:hypothetical protein